MTGPSTLIRGIDDIRAIEQTPLENRYQYRSIYEVLVRAAARHPGKVAVHYLPTASAGDEPISFTYQQLLREVNQTANLFHATGSGADTVISVLLPNLPQALIAVIGGAASGIVNMLNPYLEPHHLAEIMKAVGAKILLAPSGETDAELHQKSLDLMNLVPSLDTLLLVGGGGPERDFDCLLREHSGEHLCHSPQPAPGDVATYFHTGGTTGAPKIAPLTHGNEAYIAWALRFIPDLGSDDVVISGMPWFHGGGLFINTLAPLGAGATVVVLGPWGYRHHSAIADFWSIVERFGATFFLGVPTVFQNLLDAPLPQDVDISSLRLTACGGAPLSVEVIRRFEDKTGLTLLEGYGLTEAGVSSLRNPRDGERRIGSVGIRYPYQAVKTVILDEDGLMIRECAPGETGLVVIKGPNVFPGYLQDDYNQGLWAADGWLNSGDLGRFDEDGYLWLTGRSKDLIIRGGHNIDPQMIEDAFYKHPDVAVAAALGKPDRKVGEKPIVFVVPRAGTTPDTRELAQHARATISERAAIPVDIYIVDEIPRTEVGKIFKPRLRWRVTRQVIEQALSLIEEQGVTVKVKVGPDAQHGMMATISLAGRSEPERLDITSLVGEILAPFPFKSTIAWE